MNYVEWRTSLTLIQQLVAQQAGYLAVSQTPGEPISLLGGSNALAQCIDINKLISMEVHDAKSKIPVVREIARHSEDLAVGTDPE